MNGTDTEAEDLKALVVHTLETNGALGKIRAQLRANVYKTIDCEDEQAQTEADNGKLSKTPLGRLTAEVVAEFFDFYGFRHSLSVFVPETRLGRQRRNRADVALDSGITRPRSDLSLLEQITGRATCTNVRKSGEASGVTTAASSPPAPSSLRRDSPEESDARESLDPTDDEVEATTAKVSSKKMANSSAIHNLDHGSVENEMQQLDELNSKIALLQEGRDSDSEDSSPEFVKRAGARSRHSRSHHSRSSGKDEPRLVARLSQKLASLPNADGIVEPLPPSRKLGPGGSSLMDDLGDGSVGDDIRRWNELGRKIDRLKRGRDSEDSPPEDVETRAVARSGSRLRSRSSSHSSVSSEASQPLAQSKSVVSEHSRSLVEAGKSPEVSLEEFGSTSTESVKNRGARATNRTDLTGDALGGPLTKGTGGNGVANDGDPGSIEDSDESHSMEGKLSSGSGDVDF